MFFHFFFIKKFIKYYFLKNLYNIIKTNFNHYILFLIIFFLTSNLNLTYCEIENEIENEIEIENDFNEKLKKILIVTGLICIGLITLYFIFKPNPSNLDYDSDSSSSSSSSSILDLEEKPITTSRFITIPNCRYILKKRIYDKWYYMDFENPARVEIKEGEELPNPDDEYLKKLFNLV